MIYSPSNVQLPARVYDVDTMQEIGQVVEIDTGVGAVLCNTTPVAVGRGGELVRHTIRYRAIHAIFGGFGRPCLFHCYGRQ